MSAAFARVLYELADLLPILVCWTAAVAYVAYRVGKAKR
jgi:hypothetical protein